MRVFLLLAAFCAAASAIQPYASPVRVYDEARSLSHRSVREIVRLAARDGKGVWLLVGDTSQTLPEKRFIDAYLEPDATTPRLRRGRVVSLESRIVNGAAVHWVPRSPVARYAQVAIEPNRWPASLKDQSIERPFLIDGDFTDDDLIELVSFVRSSPKSPKRVDSDGTIQLDGEDVDGTMPITQISQRGSTVTVVLQGSTRHGQTADLSRVDGSWKLLRVTMWII
jgi:hypothetical protein